MTLSSALGQRLGALQSVAFGAGTGTGQPTGIIATAGTSSNFTTDFTAATGATTAFKTSDVKGAYLAQASEYRMNSTWVLHPTTYGELAGLSVAANDAPAFPSLQNNPPTLYGRPVVLEPGLAAPAANKVSGVFADFTRGAYVIRRVRGLGLVRQSEIHSDAGNVGYRIIERVDGKSSRLGSVSASSTVLPREPAMSDQNEPNPWKPGTGPGMPTGPVHPVTSAVASMSECERQLATEALAEQATYAKRRGRLARLLRGE